VADPLAATTLLDSGSERDALRAAETRLLGTVQRRLRQPSVVQVCKAMSLFGEHAGGWLAFGVLGAAVDRSRRRDWLYAAGGVAVAHGASMAIKRVVRRPRPNHPSIEVRAGTPSRLSFPSSHASSTTAAAVLFGALLGPTVTGARLAGVLVPPMLLSRLVLGVHFPSDVLVGSALGAASAKATRWAAKKRLAKRGGSRP
jgi:membrane-associated phospholipid phosphatase